MRPYPTAVKKKAYGLLFRGHSHQKIAQRLKVARTTITSWAQELLDEDLKGVERPKRGRPKRLSPQDLQNLKHLLLRGKVSTAVGAAREVNKGNETPISVSTVRRALKQVGGKSCKVIRKPMLRKRHKKARLQFAKKYENWTIDD